MLLGSHPCAGPTPAAHRELAAVLDDRDVAVPARSDPDDARGVIETAFELLDHVAALQPARLIDLSQTSGVPRATVHRLLKQLIEVGALGKCAGRTGIAHNRPPCLGRWSANRRHEGRGRPTRLDRVGSALSADPEAPLCARE